MNQIHSYSNQDPPLLLETDFPGFGELPADISVRCLKMDANLENLAVTMLSPEERSRRAEMKSESRQIQFALGRIALRSLLSNELRLKPSEIPLIIEKSGRLSLQNSAKSLSLAHSGQHALAAVSSDRSGVDIETIRQKPPELLDYILGEREKQHIHSLDLPEAHRLFVCWTLKEAVLKATGTGLRRSPKKVHLTVDTAQEQAVVRDPDGQIWHARYRVHENAVFALAFASDR